MSEVTVDDAVRLQRLRRMKAVATGLLVLAAVVYVLTLDREGGVWPWVNAAAEAGMVGALADWFAVTALFRHPLGIPVPHTALIPRRKDALGASLQAFVAEHFLAADVVRDKVSRAKVSSRVATWLAVEENAARATRLVARGAAGGVRPRRAGGLGAGLAQTLVQRVLAQEWSAPAGHLLEQVLEEGGHRRLTDMAFSHLHSWVRDNRAAITGIVLERAPEWAPHWVNEAIANRAYKEALAFVADVDDDQGHRARKALDDVLRRFARDLQEDPVMRARAEETMKRVLAQPDVRQALTSVWSTGRRLLVEALEDEGSALRVRASDAVVSWARSVLADPALQERLDAQAVEAAGFLVSTYGSELATVISETVERWDGDDASRRIELHVGRDLQFIRINGTVVGALAGLAIHALGVAVS